MHLSENEGVEGSVFVITGGLGFVGAALCSELVRRGAREVRAFDIRSSSPWSSHLLSIGVRCIQGDVAKKKDVDNSIEGADCVFHLASFGMSGKEMLQASKADIINIHGTCNVLDACHEFGITRLIYVSTYNVVFGGKEIINGNESLPYFPVDSHSDPYGRSKSIAEQFVLKSNGRTLRNKHRHLYTCVVRPAAIYGPGEERHLPRIASIAKMGLLRFKIGRENVKTDWVFVDNLVLALLLASMGLLDDIPGREGHPVAAGQAYFISDGYPVNSFEFLVKPLAQSLDCELPNRTLSVQTALTVANFIWILYSLLHPWLNKSWVPQPFLLPSEVHKIGVTHYFSFLKAKEELGYVPLVSPKDGLAATLSYWKERKRELYGPNIYEWLFVIIGMLMMFCAACLPPYGPLSYNYALALFVLRSRWLVRIVFGAAVAVHVCEGIYAYYLAKRVDPQNVVAWFWQTLALGGFSLRHLLRKART